MSNEAQAARAQIEAAMVEATPGPWIAEEFEAQDGTFIPSFTASPRGRFHRDPADDAAFIAACNPVNIRALLDDHEAELRGANERIDVLTETLTDLMGWQVKHVDRWHNSAYDRAHAALATNQDTQS